MIISVEYDLVIGSKEIGQITDLNKDWIIATFIVERIATLDEMLKQLAELSIVHGRKIEFFPEDHYRYYKVLID